MSGYRDVIDDYIKDVKQTIKLDTGCPIIEVNLQRINPKGFKTVNSICEKVNKELRETGVIYSDIVDVKAKYNEYKDENGVDQIGVEFLVTCKS